MLLLLLLLLFRFGRLSQAKECEVAGRVSQFSAHHPPQEEASDSHQRYICGTK